MTMLTEAAGYLVSQAVCTKIGKDLFIEEIPESPALMTALFSYGGEPPEFTHDGPGDDRPSLQVRTRAAKNGNAAGHARALAVHTALNGLSNTALSGTRWKFVRALQSEPIFLGYDEQGRPEWSQNYAIIKDPS